MQFLLETSHILHAIYLAVLFDDLDEGVVDFAKGCIRILYLNRKVFLEYKLRNAKEDVVQLQVDIVIYAHLVHVNPVEVFYTLDVLLIKFVVEHLIDLLLINFYILEIVVRVVVEEKSKYFYEQHDSVIVNDVRAFVVLAQ